MKVSSSCHYSRVLVIAIVASALCCYVTPVNATSGVLIAKSEVGAIKCSGCSGCSWRGCSGCSGCIDTYKKCKTDLAAANANIATANKEIAEQGKEIAALKKENALKKEIAALKTKNEAQSKEIAALKSKNAAPRKEKTGEWKACRGIHYSTPIYGLDCPVRILSCSFCQSALLTFLSHLHALPPSMLT